MSSLQYHSSVICFFKVGFTPCIPGVIQSEIIGRLPDFWFLISDTRNRSIPASFSLTTIRCPQCSASLFPAGGASQTQNQPQFQNPKSQTNTYSHSWPSHSSPTSLSSSSQVHTFHQTPPPRSTCNHPALWSLSPWSRSRMRSFRLCLRARSSMSCQRRGFRLGFKLRQGRVMGSGLEGWGYCHMTLP